MKKTLLAVALTAASMTAVADMSVSGHVNYKAGMLEDFQSGGVSTAQGNEDLTVGTAASSESRFRILSSTEANGITYGAKIELGLGEPDRANALNKRQNEVYVSGALGKLTLGQGSIAGDGASEENFSGTYLTSGDLSSWELGGDLADNIYADPGRTERLRYDAPKIGNLALAVSINDSEGSGAVYTNATVVGNSATLKKAAVSGNDTGNDVSVSARYAMSNIVASVGFISAEADDSDVVAASIAGQMSGFNAAVQYVTSEKQVGAVSDDFEQVRFFLGYKVGPYAVAIDHGISETDTKSVDAETTGLNFVYTPTKGVELYAGARNAQANDGALDENAFLMGARVKF
ncbi:MAG: hypothetical protein ACJAZP_004135 [Psychromonas sp.]|jgi:hypothetical protein|uniref:porin n=1 Tax=Psychromonas sp. TaxID=1884585 RepID=UPI0039E222CA